MNKAQITIEVKDNKGIVTLLHNGMPIPDLCGYTLQFNSRSGELIFKGKRFKTDRAGQFMVDEQTKDTAIEEVNLLNIFDPYVMTREKVIAQQKTLEFQVLNIFMTSMLNAEKLIEERNCQLKCS